MTDEIRKLNEACACAVGDRVHEWKQIALKHQVAYNFKRYQCCECKKDTNIHLCSFAPPACTIDYSATAGSALKFAKRAGIHIGCLTFNILENKRSGNGQFVLVDGQRTKVRDYDSIDRALGVVIYQWALKVLEEK
jgi:hypothetical protein